MKEADVNVTINRWIAVSMGAVVGLLLMNAAVAGKPAPKASKEPVLTLGKGFACTDYDGNKVCLVDEKGKITWQMPARRPQDVWLLPNGSILFTHVKGVKEVTPDKKVVGVIDDYGQFGTISSVSIMGVEGNPATFEVLW
jgi:hypothetical protein